MIEINNLTKHFDSICAVNDISLNIPDGIMFELWERTEQKQLCCVFLPNL